MEDYTWNTTEVLATNSDTMNDFIDNHFHERFSEDAQMVEEDGTYIEVKDSGVKYGVHASGNGDFCSNGIEIELLIT